MARIYDAFNALGLGQAINGLHNGIAALMAMGLQGLGDSVQNYLMAIAEEKKEAAQRKSALDYLMGRGGDKADRKEIEGIVGALGPVDAVRYISGKYDERDFEDANRTKEALQNKSAIDFLMGAGKMDKATAESLVGSVGAGEAAKHIAGRIASGEDYDRNRKDSTLDRVYSSLTQSLDLLRSKAQSGTFMSQEDVKALRDTEAKLTQFVAAHPEYAAGNTEGNNSQAFDETYFSSDAAPMTTERAIERLKSLFDERDSVDPSALDMLDKEFIRNHGVSIHNVPELKDLVELAVMSQKGGKLDRLRKNLKTGGSKTKSDADDEYKKAQFERQFEKYVKDLNAWRKAEKGTVKKPDIPEEYLKKMSKKLQSVYRSYK